MIIVLALSYGGFYHGFSEAIPFNFLQKIA